MSSNTDLDDLVIRSADGKNNVRLWRIQQKQQLVTTTGDGPQLDSFQRLRTSDPVTLFESSMEVDEQSLLWNDEFTGSGSTSYNTNESSVTLSTGAASSSAIRQSRSYLRYQPGKSLLIFFSFVMGTTATDVTRRVGYFDDDNGVFLEQTDSDIAWVTRSYTTGAAIDTRVTQANWDIDILDGTTDSGVTFDPTLACIGIIDLEWLGVGRVRVGFIINGQVYYAHGFENLGQTKVYMSRASLPIRYEIVSGAGASGSSDLQQICSTVISEGGYIPRGMIRAAGNGTTGRTTSGTPLPLLAIRLRSGYTRAYIQPNQFSVINLSGGTTIFLVQIILRASVTGGSWSQSSEATEINTTGTAVSGGYVVTEQYVEARASYAGLDLGDTTLLNASDFAGTSDIIAVVATAISGTPDAAASLQWREIF